MTPLLDDRTRHPQHYSVLHLKNVAILAHKSKSTFLVSEAPPFESQWPDRRD